MIQTINKVQFKTPLKVTVQPNKKAKLIFEKNTKPFNYPKGYIPVFKGSTYDNNLINHCFNIAGLEEGTSTNVERTISKLRRAFPRIVDANLRIDQLSKYLDKEFGINE